MEYTYITWNELMQIIREHNEQNKITCQYQDKNPIQCVVVYKQENFKKPFTEIERSYQFRSDEKFFLPAMGGNSIYGNCLDGKDLGVRLDYYDWSVEKCYIINGKEVK